MWPLRKIATAYGNCAGFARPPPTTEARARGEAGAANGRAAIPSAEAQASAAIRVRLRRLSSILCSPSPCSVEAKLVTVVAGVLVALLEHILHVIPGFRKWNLVEAQARAAPGRHVGLPRVVRGQGGDLVVAERLDQIVEVEGPVADVDVGVREVIEFEGLTAAQPLDHLRGGWRDLHQATRPRAGSLIAETRLAVDHRRDQIRGDVLLGGLLANDVLVLQRQRDLLEGALEAVAVGEQESAERADDQRPADHHHPAAALGALPWLGTDTPPLLRAGAALSRAGTGGPHGGAGAHPALLARSCSISSFTCSCNSSSEASLRITWSARRSFSS